MKVKSSLLLFIVLIFWASSLSLAQDQGKAVTGKVTGKAGDPKALASVTLNGPSRYMSMTNSVGEFKVKNVTKGKYTVTVSQGNKVQGFMIDIDGVDRLDLKVGW